MNKRGILFALLLLAVLTACSKTLRQDEAQALVREYLKPYTISGMTLDSLVQTQSPLPKAYLATVTFTLTFEDGATMPFKGQPVYLTFNEVTHAFEVNRQLSSVAQSVQETIALHSTGNYLKSHPYNPSPWKKH